METINTLNNFCFCTLALGEKYQHFASLLIKDLSKNAPQIPIVILTDNPKKFEAYRNVISYFHTQKSVGAYHDKRWAIAKSLEAFNSCIFLDSDVRILQPIPDRLEWIDTPGIQAKSCFTMPHHYSKVFSDKASQSLIKEFDVVVRASRKISLDFLNEDIYFVKEWLFSVTRDSGREQEFLMWWDKLEKYFELRGICGSEGAIIGLAAAKAGFEVNYCQMDGLSFFKHHVTQWRIQKGQVDLKDVANYFEQYKEIKYPKRSIFKRSVDKVFRISNHSYRRMSLQLSALSDIDFYYL
ncbi:hypothetical protein NDA01_00030 [Trichocoleus desertorum AS-A10]|uniref:hypothetical protein n=1 Tax=Trichocoleus desertorum TaxID=1481672 RepID=UPI0032994881